MRVHWDLGSRRPSGARKPCVFIWIWGLGGPRMLEIHVFSLGFGASAALGVTPRQMFSGHAGRGRVRKETPSARSVRRERHGRARESHGRLTHPGKGSASPLGASAALKGSTGGGRGDRGRRGTTQLLAHNPAQNHSHPHPTERREREGSKARAGGKAGRDRNLIMQIMIVDLHI